MTTPTTTAMTTDACDLPGPTRRWGGAVPAAVILALAISRFAVPDRTKAASREASTLRDKAVSAHAAGRFADAAEYARHGASRATGTLRTQLLCLRADSLSRDGHDQEAQQVLGEAAASGVPCAPSR